jgi:hypothetical protein
VEPISLLPIFSLGDPVSLVLELRMAAVSKQSHGVYMARNKRRVPHAPIVLWLFTIMMAYSASVGAVEASVAGITFTLGGFGTVGIVHSSDDQADFVSNGAQPKGAGFTNSWSVTPDSKFGLQLSAPLTDRLSVVLQAVSQYQADGTYKPDLEWGNIKFEFTRDVDIRAGRIALPTFMNSDSLNVGYALPYVRIPLEIYAQLPFPHSDGVDGSYRLHIGDVTNTVQAFAGSFDSSTPNGGHYNVHGLRGLVDTVEYDALTLHLSYQLLHYDLTVPGVVLSKDSQAILSIGASYDPGKWFLSGEWIRAPDDGFGLFYGWYVIGGYRVGQFTPYIDHARAYMTQPGSLAIPPFIDQDTSTLGLRWDFMKNVDMKMQLDHTALHSDFNEFLINQQPGFHKTAINIFSLAVDFVF